MKKFKILTKSTQLQGGIEFFEPKIYSYRWEMDTFVELKSKSDYFQEYLYQSYEYKKWSSKS